MSKLVDQYLKKVQKETQDGELKKGIQGVFDDIASEIPGLTKPKSSFKEANKRMKRVEDDNSGDKETDN